MKAIFFARTKAAAMGSIVVLLPCTAYLFSTVRSVYLKMKMSVLFLLSGCIVGIISCSETRGFRKDKALFESSAVLNKYKAVADMNDAYFEIKENNFFEFYMQLFDSVKNTRYPGRYSTKGDTLFLDFYNKKGAELLGSKALLNSRKKEIIFFDYSPGTKKRLIFN